MDTYKQTPHRVGQNQMRANDKTPAPFWDWQPIETAPKDGSQIMLFHPGGGLFSNDLVSTGGYCADSYSSRPRPYWTIDRSSSIVLQLRKNPPTLWAEIQVPKCGGQR